MTEILPASWRTSWSRLRDDVSGGLARWFRRNGRTLSRRPEETDADYFPSILSVAEPRIDVEERRDDILITAELPGLEREDFSVELNPGYLVLRGEKKLERNSRDGAWHIAECSYGAFYRALPLPCEVERDRVDAKFRNGVLLVRLVKTPEAVRRRIDIKVA